MMSKSTVNRIVIKLVLIFLIVTVYFYFQHPVIYRCTNLKAVVPIADMKVVVEDITISTLDEKTISERIFERQLSWLSTRIMQSDLSMEWKSILLKIVSFYSHWPLTGEPANIKVSGKLIYGPGIRNSEATEGYRLTNRFDVRISYGYWSGESITRENDNNYCSWQSHGKFNLDNLDRDLTLTVADETNNKVSIIYFSPRWEKERLLSGRISNISPDPADPVRNYIEQLRNKPSLALENIVPELRKDFESPRLNNTFRKGDLRYTVDWTDDLPGYQGAYLVVAEAGKYLNEDRTEFVAQTDEKLAFTVIEAKDGKYYIARVQTG